MLDLSVLEIQALSVQSPSMQDPSVPSVRSRCNRVPSVLSDQSARSRDP